ncbi:hypothetical protein BD324DRAFT_26513 [Kockovaella imperatae]|uniref:Uncharacterized protein n=1 Tax=Kockovaella imperatae TaxID=4999 RepID=A0A1Y1USB9_9TREE|nr:hypothetical protein BD324DRAFT_26513 [Kockovaella imperatae]ORX40889.1 hypothetical protein BD324DRAFT_26513 [Kockovaella imperatae]
MPLGVDIDLLLSLPFASSAYSSSRHGALALSWLVDIMLNGIEDSPSKSENRISRVTVAEKSSPEAKASADVPPSKRSRQGSPSSHRSQKRARTVCPHASPAQTSVPQSSINNHKKTSGSPCREPQRPSGSRKSQDAANVQDSSMGTEEPKAIPCDQADKQVPQVSQQISNKNPIQTSKPSPPTPPTTPTKEIQKCPDERPHLMSSGSSKGSKISTRGCDTEDTLRQARTDNTATNLRGDKNGHSGSSTGSVDKMGSQSRVGISDHAHKEASSSRCSDRANKTVASTGERARSDIGTGSGRSGEARSRPFAIRQAEAGSGDGSGGDDSRGGGSGESSRRRANDGSGDTSNLRTISDDPSWSSSEPVTPLEQREGLGIRFCEVLGTVY